LDKFGQLINLSKAGQLAMRESLESYFTDRDLGKTFPRILQEAERRISPIP
jgi:hypothetical protein